jgi:serine/threonine protein phosphatase 1
MSDSQIFATLRWGQRVWAVASIHGEAGRLTALHRELERRFLSGDRLVYLGNIFGRSTEVRATVDEILEFRRGLLARPGMFACDIAYLRGSQEEMWHKLLQLQMAPNPSEVLNWILDHGVGATLAAYGGDAERGLDAARQGAMAITRWTSGLRAAMRAAPGHEPLFSALRRAAFTDETFDIGGAGGGEAGGALLFVNAGIDPSRPLSAQTDSFWWGTGGFAKITAPYGGFRMIVRGFDPAHGGVQTTEFTASIDAGCGFGGPLIAACFDGRGRLVDRIEA